MGGHVFYGIGIKQDRGLIFNCNEPYIYYKKLIFNQLNPLYKIATFLFFPQNASSLKNLFHIACTDMASFLCVLMWLIELLLPETLDW